MLQQQITQFATPKFSLGEDEIYVKIFTGLGRERVTQVEGDQQQYFFRSNNIQQQQQLLTPERHR